MIPGVEVLGRRVHFVRGVKGDRMVFLAFSTRGIRVPRGNVCVGIMRKCEEGRLPIWPKALVRGVAGTSDEMVVEIRVSSRARRASTSERRERTVLREEVGSWEGEGVEESVSWYGVGGRGPEYVERNLEGGSEWSAGD